MRNNVQQGQRQGQQREILEGIEWVRWGAVGHARGPATDLPALLGLLRSEDAEARSEAQAALSARLWQEGMVYAATSLAVPFLVRLLGERSSSNEGVDRAWILRLLARLLDARSALEGDCGFFTAEEREALYFRRQLERERGWIRDTRRAVLEGAPAYRALAAHPDARLRAAAAELLRALDLREEGAQEPSRRPSRLTWIPAAPSAPIARVAA